MATFSPTVGTLNSYVVFPLNLVLPLFSQTLAPVKHPSPNTFSLGRRGLQKGTILNTTSHFYSLFYYHMVNNFVPERKRIPFPLTVLRNFILTPN